MSRKNVLLVALVLVNMLLVTAVVLQVSWPRTANAQVRGGGNDYVVVTARMLQGNEDAIWILDLKTRKLHAFRLPQGKDNLMIHIGTREIEKDLRPAKPAGKPG